MKFTIEEEESNDVNSETGEFYPVRYYVLVERGKVLVVVLLICFLLTLPPLFFVPEEYLWIAGIVMVLAMAFFIVGGLMLAVDDRIGPVNSREAAERLLEETKKRYEKKQ